jgi:hypothetical protein
MPHHRAKLDDVKACEIRNRYRAGTHQRKLAQEYGVSQARISQVVHRDMLKLSGADSRAVVEMHPAGEDGWAEFWLECGHGGRILIGYGNAGFAIGERTGCWPCQQEAERKAEA